MGYKNCLKKKKKVVAIEEHYRKSTLFTLLFKFFFFLNFLVGCGEILLELARPLELFS